MLHLRDRRRDVGGLRGAHALHRNRMAGPDRDGADRDTAGRDYEEAAWWRASKNFIVPGLPGQIYHWPDSEVKVGDRTFSPARWAHKPARTAGLCQN